MARAAPPGATPMPPTDVVGPVKRWMRSPDVAFHTIASSKLKLTSLCPGSASTPPYTKPASVGLGGIRVCSFAPDDMFHKTRAPSMLNVAKDSPPITFNSSGHSDSFSCWIGAQISTLQTKTSSPVAPTTTVSPSGEVATVITPSERVYAMPQIRWPVTTSKTTASGSPQMIMRSLPGNTSMPRQCGMRNSRNCSPESAFQTVQPWPPQPTTLPRRRTWALCSGPVCRNVRSAAPVRTSHAIAVPSALHVSKRSPLEGKNATPTTWS
mmetsp:Transcript_63347/g.182279  ORF Transcript_63347/g.182279 Transcript_63347/m.182279 type:complete len:267 (+) Transcript_63347:298-1098(+)